MKDGSLPALVAEDPGGGKVLRAPKIGNFIAGSGGELVTPGTCLGTIAQGQRRYAVIVPEGATGRIVPVHPRGRTVPVGYGAPLFHLAPLSDLAAPPASVGGAGAVADDALAVAAPTDGVFYRAPGLHARPYVAPGQRISRGQPVGLIEVMKTFNPIAYEGTGLPDEAIVVAILAEDGSEVRAGQPLILVKTP